MEAPTHVVGRVGAILRVVAKHEPVGATTSAVGRDSGVSRPTAHRLLSSLLDEGLVDRDASSGRWVLGPELYLLGVSAQQRYDVTALAHPFVRRLAASTGESAFFSARRGDETVCLVREDGAFPIRSHVLHEGIRFPLGVASAGMAILAHLPDREVEAFLMDNDLVEGYGKSHSPESLRTRVEEVRTAGYALNPGLIVEGSWGMGAAVFDPDQEPRWALSLTGIERRFDAKRRPELGRVLLHEAHQLSLAIQRR
jgi:DNA-binding IclR family transcriptional regulator